MPESSLARAMPRPHWLWAGVLLAACLGAQTWAPPAGTTTLRVAPRPRRHARSTPRHLRLLGWNLELHENSAIRSPYYDECLFYRGKIIGEEHSTATVTECGGQLYGLIQVGEEEFVLQPTPVNAEGTHVLRRRDVTLEEPAQYNLTGDTVTDLDFDFDFDDEPMVPHVRPRHSNDTPKLDYLRSGGQGPVTRSISGVKGLWLEMAIVADHTMMKFHGRERVKHYILALMNIVSAIFNDPSLNSNMTLVINKLFLYEEKDSIIKYGNVKKSLEAVNKWNYRHLIRLPGGSTGWDATVWLTRSVLGGPSGYAPVGGVCSRKRSAAIDRDEGLTSAFVIAHELGHLLGLHHDGPEHCQAKGSVMAPTVLATIHNYAWSTCSRDQFHEKSKLWWCLHERSREDGVELGGAKEIYNYVFTMEEQCRTEFGEGLSVRRDVALVKFMARVLCGVMHHPAVLAALRLRAPDDYVGARRHAGDAQLYSVCKTVKVRSACSRLWCAHRSMPHVCRSKRASPLEGTPCGPNKWCVKRVCEPMLGFNDTAKTVEAEEEKNRWVKVEDEKGHWSEWGRWSDCGAECGYGLRARARKCRYKGGISERACEGAGSQVAVCWAGRACAASRDIRADLCFRQQTSFIPHLHPDESKHCEIWCMDYKGGEASIFGALPDGTPCSYERPYDVCFQGTCVKGQCNSTDPTCNWCPDGYCNNNTHIYTRQIGKEWSRMTMVPHEAHQLSVHIASPTPLHIALRERKRDKPVLELSRHSQRSKQNEYLKYDPNVPQNLQIIDVDSHVIDIKEDREGQVVAAGTVIRWRQTDADVFITSIARLQTDLLIMAIPENPLPSGELIDVQVSVNYSTPASIGRARPLEYRWTLARGPCSASCGGGVRAVRARCTRDMKCPPTRYESCNAHSCDFSWSPGAWEECSATCGYEGIQERQMFCLPANISTSSQREMFKYSVSPYLCPTTRPDKERPCNRLPCPVYWKEMSWTPCSTTCGRGISRRPLTCPATDEVLCGPKPRERRRRCRLRRCQPSPLTTCPSDTTQYCELFSIEDLKRHCLMPPFRRYCCNACKGVEYR